MEEGQFVEEIIGKELPRYVQQKQTVVGKIPLDPMAAWSKRKLGHRGVGMYCKQNNSSSPLNRWLNGSHKRE